MSVIYNMYPSLVLLVEDDLDLGAILRKTLEQQFPKQHTSIVWVKTLHDAYGVMSYAIPDMIFLDLRLPDSPEQETLSRMLLLAGTSPIVVLSGYYSSMEGLAAIASGAEDFVLKGPNCVKELQIAASKAWARVLSGNCKP